MNTLSRTFSFLTAGFPHGAYQGQSHSRPELRGPTVRGQLRWWFAALYGQAPDGRAGDDEDRIFGGVQEKSRASLFAVQVGKRNVPPPKKRDVLPHKHKHQGSKSAFVPKSPFTVKLRPRRGGLSQDEMKKLERVLDAWLLLGGVGQRANRGAGTLWPENAPSTEDEYGRRCETLLDGSEIRFAVLDKEFPNEICLRRLAGDILAPEEFERCGTPFGSAQPRKPSPLKLRAAWLNEKLRLIAVWDSRHQQPTDLRSGTKILCEKDKPLGPLLEPVLDRLTRK